MRLFNYSVNLQYVKNKSLNKPIFNHNDRISVLKSLKLQ